MMSIILSDPIDSDKSNFFYLREFRMANLKTNDQNFKFKTHVF